MVLRLAQLAAILLALLSGVGGALAMPIGSDRAKVNVNIEVHPIAQVNLPNGPNFVLRVPHIPHCSPKKDRDKGWNDWYWNTYGGWGNSWGGSSHGGKNERDEWRDWNDDDWNRWGDNDWWDDWDPWNGSDWQHNGWYGRCKRWLSEWYWPVIKPVRIPFTVTGNAIAEVSVRPHQFIKIKSGKYLGKATGPSNRTIGYDTIVHFPAPKSNYFWLSGWDFYDDWHDWRRWAGFGSLPSWSKWAKLPGTNNTGTPFLGANMVQRGGTAQGVVYIVSRRDFTTDGKKAKPGDYAGTIVLTVVADNI